MMTIKEANEKIYKNIHTGEIVKGKLTEGTLFPKVKRHINYWGKVYYSREEPIHKEHLNRNYKEVKHDQRSKT